MYRISEEISKREQSKLWSEEIARRVISEKSRRAKTRLSVTGSLIVVFVLSFVVGFNISRGHESDNWVDDFISSVTDDTYYQSDTQGDLFNFVTYSFNGQ